MPDIRDLECLSSGMLGGVQNSRNMYRDRLGWCDGVTNSLLKTRLRPLNIANDQVMMPSCYADLLALARCKVMEQCLSKSTHVLLPVIQKSIVLASHKGESILDVLVSWTSPWLVGVRTMERSNRITPHYNLAKFWKNAYILNASFPDF